MNVFKRLINTISGSNSIEDNPLYDQLKASGAILKDNSPIQQQSFGQSHCDIMDRFDDEFYKRINIEGTVRVSKEADAPYVSISKLLGKAFVSNEWKSIEDILHEDVILTLYDDREIVGKSNVIDYWQDWERRYNEPYSGTMYSVKFCKYFSRTALLISPRNAKPMYLIARFSNNLVKDLLLVENPLQSPMIRYWSLDNESLSFNNCTQLYTDLGKEIEPKGMRIPCMTCGCRSNKMQWYEFQLRKGPLVYNGELSLCPECMQFVEYRPDSMFR